MRKKNDSQLLAEAYEGVSRGGPLGGGSKAPSKANSTTTEQGGEDKEEGGSYQYYLKQVETILGSLADLKSFEGVSDRDQMIINKLIDVVQRKLSKEEDEEGGEEEDTNSLMALVAKLLAGVADGSIDEGEACEHVKMVLSGEVEESEHESKEEQEKEDEGDYSEHDEDEEKNKKRNTVQQATDAMRAQFGKGEGKSNIKRPQPDRNVQGIKRSTSQYQQGM